MGYSFIHLIRTEERDDDQVKVSCTFEDIAGLSVPEAGLAAGSDAMLLTVWSEE